MKRIRISFSKKKFKRVKVLAGHNDDLAKLLGSTDELSVLRERRKNLSAPVLLFQKVQDYAFSLHITLKTKWRCDCPIPHEVKLQLDKRLKSGRPATAHLKARFVFGDSLCEPRSKTIRDVEIRVREKAEYSEEIVELHPSNDFAIARQQMEFASSAVAATARVDLESSVISSSIISATGVNEYAPESLFKRYGYPENTSKYLSLRQI